MNEDLSDTDLQTLRSLLGKAYRLSQSEEQRRDLQRVIQRQRAEINRLQEELSVATGAAASRAEIIRWFQEREPQ